MRRLVVLLHTGHPNDFESAQYQRRAFQEFGYLLEEYSVADPNVGQKLSTLLQSRYSEIAFFLSSNYYGARIVNERKELLHTMTGIPLVIMQHDHPLYFLREQAPQLNGTITFAVGEESVDFIKQYYSLETTFVTRSGARPVVKQSLPDYTSFMAKKNAILSPMNLAVNGLNIDGTWQLIKQLPEPRRSFAIELSERAMYDPITPLHVIAQAVQPIPAIYATSIYDQLLVLNFIKVWRRNFIVRKLVDLDIVISSEYIPADLEFKYKKKLTLFTRLQTMQLYDSYRFILNCNPVMTNVLHERVLEALYSNSVAITDPNATISEYLEDGRDYIGFTYDAKDIEAKVAWFLSNPDEAYTLTQNAYEKRQRTRDFGLIDSYARLLDAVDTLWCERAM